MWSHEEIHFFLWPHSWPSCDISHYLLLQQIAALGKASYFFHKTGNRRAQIELILFGNHSVLELYPNIAPACSHKSTSNQGCNSCLCYLCPLLLLQHEEWGHPGAMCWKRRTAMLRRAMMALVPRSLTPWSSKRAQPTESELTTGTKAGSSDQLMINMKLKHNLNSGKYESIIHIPLIPSPKGTVKTILYKICPGEANATSWRYWTLLPCLFHLSLSLR